MIYFIFRFPLDWHCSILFSLFMVLPAPLFVECGVGLAKSSKFTSFFRASVKTVDFFDTCFSAPLPFRFIYGIPSAVYSRIWAFRIPLKYRFTKKKQAIRHEKRRYDTPILYHMHFCACLELTHALIALFVPFGAWLDLQAILKEKPWGMRYQHLCF